MGNRPCDSWVELETREGARLSLGGHSSLRILQGHGHGGKVALLKGSAWLDPNPQSDALGLAIETPAGLEIHRIELTPLSPVIPVP